MELMDFGTFVKDVGFPIAAATALMAFIWYGLRMTAQLIKRIVDLFDQNAKQIVLLRELLDKRNAAEDLSNSKFQGLIESLAKAISANTEATNASARSITDGLTQILGKAIESHVIQADRVIARVDAAQAGISQQVGERSDAIADALRTDDKRLAALDAKIQALPQAFASVFAKEFQPVVRGIKEYHRVIEAKLTDQEAKLTDQRELINALNERERGLVDTLVKAMQSTITTVVDDVRKIVTPPPAPADALQAVAPALAAATTKRATDTLSAVAADVTPPDAVAANAAAKREEAGA
jgi:hypothetical protein